MLELRRPRRWTIATSFALLTMATAVAALAFMAAMGGTLPAAAAPVAQDPPAESPCSAASQAVVAPDIVLQGETVGVTLTVQASCPAVTPTIHIVLVLDGSASMSGAPSRDLKSTMRDLVTALDLEDEPGIQVGVVGHGDGAATVLCQLTNRSGQINGCIGRVGESGAPALDGAIDEARTVLTRGRAGIPSPDDVREIVFIASGSAIAGNGCSDVQRSAGQLKGQGVLVMTACAGRDCDEQCLQQTASSPRYYFDDLDNVAINRVFEMIVQQAGGTTLLRQMMVTETLAAGVELIADSAQPAPNEISPDGRTLVWRTAFVPRPAGITLTFRVRPSRLGPQSIGSATGSFTDTNDLGGAFAFGAQRVMVLAPDPVATATPEGTVEPDPSPTATPADTSTPPPDDTPTPQAREYTLYLPIVYLNYEP